jgi:hypothetical protein
MTVTPQADYKSCQVEVETMNSIQVKLFTDTIDSSSSALQAI